MSMNIFSVYKISIFYNVVCLNGLHNIWSQIFNYKFADIRVSKIPQGIKVNDLRFCLKL